MHARPASLVTPNVASISRAAAHTFHIFKMLVDDEFWPLRNIVKFAGEFRSIGTAKRLLHGVRRSSGLVVLIVRNKARRDFLEGVSRLRTLHVGIRGSE